MRDQHLDLARSELSVGLALGALAHHAGNLDGPLGTDGLSGVERGAAGMLRVEGDLRNALAVAQVDEDQAAVVAATPHPTGEGHLLANVLEAKLVARMRVHGVDLGHKNLLIRAAPCRYGRLAVQMAPPA